MKPGSAKTGVFVIEGINAFATTYFGSYVFFWMKHQFGFSQADNLALSAMIGFIYIGGAWWGGRFAQKQGYFPALWLGIALMSGGLACAGLTRTVPGQLLGVAIWTLGMCLMWPTLEALASEGETWGGLQRKIGVYNLTWAAGAALAFFFGGALIEKLGWASLFWLPIALHGVQFLFLMFQQNPQAPGSSPESFVIQRTAMPHENGSAISPEGAKSFLRMAWVANPFAYIAINSVIPVIPDLAARFELTPMLAGFACSVFYLARFGAFLILWLWPGWHYRFKWLGGAYAVLLASYAALLLIPSVWVLILAQILFGSAIGLIYYSSLFYSMDVGETKGEHGGLHEAAIGTGLFAGPATGAFTMYFLPRYTHSGTLAVCGLLLVGGTVLWGLHRQRKPERN
jgi:MFS family permease